MRSEPVASRSITPRSDPRPKDLHHARLLAVATLAAACGAPRPTTGEPIKLLIITGDTSRHDWKATTQALKEILSAGGKIDVDVTTTPAKDLTDENLAKYDVLLLNYRDTAKGEPETQVVRRQQGGVPQGRQGRQGAGRLPLRLGRLRQAELGRVREGDRRRLADPGLPRPEARVHRQEDRRQAPDLRGPARRSSTT